MKREYPDAPVVAVGAIIIHEGKVLLVKRAHEPSRGLWSIPGGVVELGEPVREAIKREVREECGLEIEVGPVFEVVDSIIRDKEGQLQFHYAIIDFLARPKSGELCVASDAEAARWFAPQELDGLPMPSGTREILLRAFKEIDGYPLFCYNADGNLPEVKADATAGKPFPGQTRCSH